MTELPREGSSSGRRLVLVVGIGRSGTSLFTGILGQLGFSVPQPEVEANATNPRGFSEPRWVVDFHTRLMRPRRITVFDSRPVAWESAAEAAEDASALAELRSWLEVQFVGTDNVVVKDPRIGWFLPLWLRCAEEIGVETCFATLLRDPHEVVRSARRWYGEWQNDASRAAAWLNVTLHVEAATRGSRRAFVRYDDLLESWPREISRAGEALGIPWLVGVDAAQAPEVERLVDPTLKRSVGRADSDLPTALDELLQEVWELVSQLARPGGEDAGATAKALDEARAAYVRLYDEAEAVAQSSITAVKPRGGGRGVARARAKAAKNGRRHFLFADLVPRKQQGPARLAMSRGRAKLRTLPVRMALRVPVRYRERVPVAVVRVVARLARSVDR